MRNFLLAKRLNLMMVFAISISVNGINSIIAGYYIAGIAHVIAGILAYTIFDDDFTIPEDTRVYEPKPSEDPSLLPIEWDAAFNEPPATIPNDFFTKITKG